MSLSLQTDYALRTLIYLAGRPDRTNIARIAEFYAISKDHVSKVVQQLSRLGYVRTIRGVGGGVELARQAEDIFIGEVVLAFEGNMHLLECVATDGVCSIQPACGLRGVLAEAERRQVAYLNSVRLSDVVVPGGQLVELSAAPAKDSKPS